MKAATVLIDDQPVFALEVDQHWFDFAKMLYAYSLLSPTMPEPGDVQLDEWVKHGLLWSEKIAAIVTQLSEEYGLDQFAIAEPNRFLLPYRPGKIICLGRNYAAHARELGNEVPETPILFEKLPSTCIGDGEAVQIHPDWGRVDYEGELAIVIGKSTHDVTASTGMDYVCGYTLLNDITARDVQSRAKEKGLPWLTAKNRDTFCPIGPAITLTDAITKPDGLKITLKVNGETKQHGNTDQFIFPVSDMIRHISQYLTLQPGDVIATGTPEGVGPIAAGDLIELTVPEIGTLRTNVSEKQNFAKLS